MVRQKIIDDQIFALKNRNQEKLSILRYILAQIKNKDIEKKLI
ncbi:GatB/YqeY domain-containing protein [Candidatus Roizmanbacteria bacterium]|nr:GatB/YqeY domain-containing protein [Candidatus Roizmanbacteria bacterium]